MKKTYTLVALVILFCNGCKKNDESVDSNYDDVNLEAYFPVKEGYTWTYSSSAQTSTGVADSATSSVELSVLKAHILVGGQPNAFILRAEDGQGTANNLTFFIQGKTFYHFLGETSEYPLSINYIYWSPGGLSGARAVVNRAIRFKITDNSSEARSFSIKRLPDPRIATATMVTDDTIQITGTAVGNTTFVVQQDNGTEQDTMTILVEVATNTRTIGPPYSSWLPIWQLTNSTDGEVMYSWDTTYAFKIFDDSSFVSDNISYRITNRYIGDDDVAALNTTIHCQKFDMKVMVIETVIHKDNFASQVVFAGPSTDYTITTWLAKGIGFVKGITNGNSRPLSVVTGGAKDSEGILHGYYISPRVRYLVIESSQSSYAQYFTVDTVPLSSKVNSDFIVLRSKNF